MAAGQFAKYTLVFKDTANDIGWTESYYGAIPGGGAPGWQDTLAGTFQPFRMARQGVLLSTCFIVAVKISDDQFFGDMVLYAVNYQGTFSSGSPQFPGPLDAALVEARDNTGQYRTRKFYHGVDMNSFSQRIYTPTPLMLSAISTLRAQELACGVLQKNKNKAVPPLTPFVYPAVADVFVRRLTGHRVGRPFDYLRGRRRIA